MSSSGFGHGFEEDGEGLLQESMRKKRGCMCKEKGRGGIFMELGCRWVQEVEDKKWAQILRSWKRRAGMPKMELA